MSLIRSATPEDVTYIVSLHRKLSEYLGLVPAATYEERLHHIKIADEDGDPVGFVYAGSDRGIVTIHQVAVQDDARRLEIGTKLIKAVEAMPGALALRCRVRESIPDREFWPAVGFDLTNTVPGGKRRGKDLLVYRKDIATPLLPPLRRAG